MRSTLGIPRHNVIAKPRHTLMTWFKDQCSHGRSEHCDAVTASLLFELAVNLRSWNNHFCDERGHTVNGVTAVFEQVRLMSLPNVNHAKTFVCAVVYTHAQKHLTTRQVKFRHVWNRAKAKPAIRMGYKRVLFEFEQFGQKRIQSHCR